MPLSEPLLDGREWEYVKECLDTGWVSSAGKFVDRFEEQTAAVVGAKHAVAVSSGTAALHLALLVAGVKPEDEVLVSTLTFIAPANAIRYVGAWPVFIDAEPRHWQMDPEEVVRFLETECEWAAGELRNRETGRRVSAILPVHILGHPVDMDPILAGARKYGLRVIEDATESLGASYRGTPVGRLGDLACFSFNGNKVITTGGGGMIVTDNAEFADRARHLSTQAKDDPVEYVHSEVGYNYRLTNVQAAIGCAQLEKLPEYVAQKREIAATYHHALQTLGFRMIEEASWARSTWWLSSVLATEGVDARVLMRALADRQIQTRPLWQPLHKSAALWDAPRRDCPGADNIHARALSLPSSVGLSNEQQLRVIDVIKSNIPQDQRGLANAS